MNRYLELYNKYVAIYKNQYSREEEYRGRAFTDTLLTYCKDMRLPFDEEAFLELRDIINDY